MDLRKGVGVIGEELICNYLLKNDYEIIDRNLRLGHLEIDIIAIDKSNSEIVFIEVKTRTSYSLDGFEQDLKSEQIKKLKRAMLLYSELKNINSEKIRLDFLAVFLDKMTHRAKVKHLIDILK